MATMKVFIAMVKIIISNRLFEIWLTTSIVSILAVILEWICRLKKLVS